MAGGAANGMVGSRGTIFLSGWEEERVGRSWGWAGVVVLEVRLGGEKEGAVVFREFKVTAFISLVPYTNIRTQTHTPKQKNILCMFCTYS